MGANQLNSLIDTAIGKIKEMVNSSTVVGEPIEMAGGTIAVPVCKVTIGFGSGGSDIPTKNANELFGGGTGAGVSVTPIAFLVTTADGGVKILQLDTIGTTADNIVRTVPEVIDKVSGLFAGNKGKE